MYYADPDGNQMEFQVETFEAHRVAPPELKARPRIKGPGVEFDPDAWLVRLRMGTPDTALLIRSVHEPMSLIRGALEGGQDAGPRAGRRGPATDSSRCPCRRFASSKSQLDPVVMLSGPEMSMASVNAVLLGSLVVLLMASAAPRTSAEEGAGAAPDMKLSHDLQALLRGEMRELLGGTQAIAAALPVGDWGAIATTSRKMKDSYILNQALTPAQAEELSALPSHFKELDEAFHARADKLREAAERHDPEAAAFHYSRLLEACVGCHASFARSRFPSLGSPASEPHHH